MNDPNNEVKLFWENVDYFIAAKGMARKEVYRWEHKNRNITIKKAMEIAGILEMPLGNLFDPDFRQLTKEEAYNLIKLETGLTSYALKDLSKLVKLSKIFVSDVKSLDKKLSN